MQGTLSEFTLAQLLQFMSIAERSGTITLQANGQSSRLLVDGDRVTGWGFDDFDILAAVLACELLPETVRASLNGIMRRSDTPGLSAIISNLLEPGRWNAFVERVLEQEVYPLLNAEDGTFEIEVGPCPPAPLRFVRQANSLILDGSRWESEIEAAEQAGFTRASVWQRKQPTPPETATLNEQEWMIWASLGTPRSVDDIARALCIPALPTLNGIRRLQQVNLVVPA